MSQRDAHISIGLSIIAHVGFAIGVFCARDSIPLLASQHHSGSKTLAIRLQPLIEQEVEIQKRVRAPSIEKTVLPKEEKTVLPQPDKKQDFPEFTNEQAADGARAMMQHELLMNEENGQQTDDYRSLILSLIAKEKRYPPRAQRLRLEGEVLVSIQVSNTGKLLGARITKNAKYSFFDREVLRMIHAAAPFPRPEKAFQSKTLTFQIPIEFELK